MTTKTSADLWFSPTTSLGVAAEDAGALGSVCAALACRFRNTIFWVLMSQQNPGFVIKMRAFFKYPKPVEGSFILKVILPFRCHTMVLYHKLRLS